MKTKTVSLLAALALMISLHIPGFALSGTVYGLKEVGLSVEIPTDYYVLTRDIASNDPALSFFGFSKNDCISFMENSNIYLDAVDRDVTTEIVVTMTDNVLSDLNLLPDTTIDLLLSSLSELYSAQGVTISETEYYQHKQAKFVVLSISQRSDAGAMYGLQYYTIYDGKSINVTLHSYDGPLSAQDKSLAKEIVDSVSFDSSPNTPEPTRQTQPISYTDSQTGTSFIVPSNWETDELVKPRETIDVKFVSTDNEAFILYGSVDAWAELSDSERAGATRSDFDTSIFSDDDIKELASTFCPTNKGTYKKEVIAGAEYWCFDINYSEATISIPGKAYITCNNGYFYIFQYCGGKSNAHLDDFVSLLNSVSFKETTNGSETLWASLYAKIFIAVLLAGVAGCIVLFINKSKKKRTVINKNVQNLSAEPSNNVESTKNENESFSFPTQEVKAANICPACGREVPPASKFCQFCGNKLAQ